MGTSSMRVGGRRREVSNNDIMEFSSKRVFVLLAIAMTGLSLIGESAAAPPLSSLEEYPVLLPLLNDMDDSSYMLRYIPELRNILTVSPESLDVLQQKRGIDFGLGRGYSGSQAARHMLGLQQASFAG